MGPDGLLRYTWRGDDPNHAENRALREAMHRQVPLIWFCGVGQGVYRPVFPVYLLWEEREQQQFVIDPDIARGLVDRDTPLTEHLRRYVLRETRQRLHQPVFRATVLRAYDTRCAVCALRHRVLLDAAHIVPDREKAESPPYPTAWLSARSITPPTTVMSSGSGPGLVVEIRADLLEEVDGPMLEDGSKGRHGRRLMAFTRDARRAPRPRTARPPSSGVPGRDSLILRPVAVTFVTATCVLSADPTAQGAGRPPTGRPGGAVVARSHPFVALQ